MNRTTNLPADRDLVDEVTAKLSEQAAVSDFLREVFEMCSARAGELAGRSAGFTEAAWEGLIVVARNQSRDLGEISDRVPDVAKRHRR